MKEPIEDALRQAVANQKTILEILSSHGEWLNMLGAEVIENRSRLTGQAHINTDVVQAIRTARAETASLARACGFTVTIEPPQCLT